MAAMDSLLEMPKNSLKIDTYRYGGGGGKNRPEEKGLNIHYLPSLIIDAAAPVS